MFASQPETDAARVTYTFPISTNTVTLSVGRPEIGSPLFGTADCTWRLQYAPLSIDEEYEITHIDGEINCQRLPAFSFAIDFPFGATTCAGTIAFESFTYQKIPYQHRWPVGQEEIQTLTVPCGDCLTSCYVLAIKEGDASDYGYSTGIDCEEIVWNQAEQAWISLVEEVEYRRIDHVEIDGKCYLRLVTWPVATLVGDLIEITNCDLGMVLTIQDELGNWAQISCNLCECWQHICGTCRCVCETLCLLNIDNGVVTGPHEADWDSRRLRWEVPDSAVPLVGIGRKEPSGDCQVTMEGFTAIDLDNRCGDAVSFVFSNTPEEQLVDGVNMWIGFCKACEGSCNGGTCLSDCEEVPRVLYATITPDPFDEMLGCEGSPATQCFETFTMPVVQMFIPTTLNPAGEWRWQGSHTFQCRGCDTGGNPSHKEYRTTIISLDIGCDGRVYFSITGYNTSGVLATFSDDFSLEFALPCGEGVYGDWTLLELGTVFSAGSGLLCCNTGAGWIVELSENAP